MYERKRKNTKGGKKTVAVYKGKRNTNNGVGRKYNKRYIPNQFPSTMTVKLRHQADYNLNITASSGAMTTYSMNSPFDPYLAAGGGACSGFTAWTNIYDRYRCRYCKIILEGVVTENDNNSLVVGLKARTPALNIPSTTALYGDWLIEGKGAIYKRIPQYESGQDYPKFYFKKYYDVAKIVINNDKVLGDEHYSADVTADPPVQPVIDLVAGYTTGTGTCKIATHVTLIYYTTFFQPKIEENIEA